MASEESPLLALAAHEAIYNRFAPHQKMSILFHVSFAGLLAMFVQVTFVPSIPRIAKDLDLTDAVVRLEDSYAWSDSFRPARALVLGLHDSHRLPDFPYTRASSSFSAAVQLYPRSSQLNTAEVRHRRFRDISLWCHFGCDAFQSVHHVFALYPAFLAIRHAYSEQLCDESSSLLEGKTTDRVREVLELAARHLFSDDAGLWPQYRMRSYASVVPPLARIVRDMSETEVGVLPLQSHGMGNFASSNAGVLSPQLDSAMIEPGLLSRLAQAWHAHSTRFAGHLGDYKRRMRSLNAAPSHKVTYKSLDTYAYLLPASLLSLL
ncbi:uncharacterized protein F5891DRAFT_1258312 [Suillus fuscotomentosus]|uniref:Uncharacterized protein n=1 Tax=Suillus fuscotomentosus TaxID=1912939 RepID=A0AAD4DTK0_9AGAM|nr:uncharacterized protein F5891DRAFT_1258312 [Suillus fuscotomentosus]KAG1893693.1 hypothetical protein F5891DRAFT_1258312 [Suillus fuscotomentosus]